MSTLAGFKFSAIQKQNHISLVNIKCIYFTIMMQLFYLFERQEAWNWYQSFSSLQIVKLIWFSTSSITLINTLSIPWHLLGVQQNLNPLYLDGSSERFWQEFQLVSIYCGDCSMQTLCIRYWKNTNISKKNPMWKGPTLTR